MPLFSTSGISSSRSREIKTPIKIIITLLRATTTTAISKQTTLPKGASIYIQTSPLLSRIKVKQLKNVIKGALSLLTLKKRKKITSFQLLPLLLQEYLKTIKGSRDNRGNNKDNILYLEAIKKGEGGKGQTQSRGDSGV